jgi:hypothetical protein
LAARLHNIIAQWESENESPCVHALAGRKECAGDIIEPKQMVERRVAAYNDLDLLNEFYVNLSFIK